jgi:hypothetical protein
VIFTGAWSAGKPATRHLPLNWHVPPLQRQVPSRGFQPRILTGRQTYLGEDVEEQEWSPET